MGIGQQERERGQTMLVDGERIEREHYCMLFGL